MKRPFPPFMLFIGAIFFAPHGNAKCWVDADCVSSHFCRCTTLSVESAMHCDAEGGYCLPRKLRVGEQNKTVLDSPPNSQARASALSDRLQELRRGSSIAPAR